MTGISVGVRYGFFSVVSAPGDASFLCIFRLLFIPLSYPSLTAQLLNLTEVKPHEYSHS